MLVFIIILNIIIISAPSLCLSWFSCLHCSLLVIQFPLSSKLCLWVVTSGHKHHSLYWIQETSGIRKSDAAVSLWVAFHLAVDDSLAAMWWWVIVVMSIHKSPDSDLSRFKVVLLKTPLKFPQVFLPRHRYGSFVVLLLSICLPATPSRPWAPWGQTLLTFLSIATRSSTWGAWDKEMTPAEEANLWALQEGWRGKSSSSCRGMDQQQALATSRGRIPTATNSGEEGLGNVWNLRLIR